MSESLKVSQIHQVIDAMKKDGDGKFASHQRELTLYKFRASSLSKDELKSTTQSVT